ncbi:MAG: ribosomal-processing cysteine protease Prp [Bacilli bacterium]|nr:ribosomal-processing cysteine protease Prp [Bacilli bacterium]
MIKIKLKKKDNNIIRIVITGHALYDDFGKDIVCAAVSSTVITTINACLSIDKDYLEYNDREGLNIEIKKNDETLVKIINSMISNLNQLEKAYPNNIQIKEENNE